MSKRTEKVDGFIGHLSEGMRVEIYNANGTLRFAITIERPTVLTMESEPKTTGLAG